MRISEVHLFFREDNAGLAERNKYIQARFGDVHASVDQYANFLAGTTGSYIGQAIDYVVRGFDINAFFSYFSNDFSDWYHKWISFYLEYYLCTVHAYIPLQMDFGSPLDGKYLVLSRWAGPTNNGDIIMHIFEINVV